MKTTEDWMQFLSAKRRCHPWNGWERRTAGPHRLLLNTDSFPVQLRAAGWKRNTHFPPKSLRVQRRLEKLWLPCSHRTQRDSVWSLTVTSSRWKMRITAILTLLSWRRRRRCFSHRTQRETWSSSIKHMRNVKNTGFYFFFIIILKLFKWWKHENLSYNKIKNHAMIPVGQQMAECTMHDAFIWWITLINISSITFKWIYVLYCFRLPAWNEVNASHSVLVCQVCV